MKEKSLKQRVYIVQRQAVRDFDLRTIKASFSSIYLNMVFTGNYVVSKQDFFNFIKDTLHINSVPVSLYQDIRSLLNKEFPKVIIRIDKDTRKSCRLINGFYYEDKDKAAVKSFNISMLRACLYDSIINEQGHSFLGNILFLLMILVSILFLFSLASL
jgi:hypothetical protein